MVRLYELKLSPHTLERINLSKFQIGFEIEIAVNDDSSLGSEYIIDSLKKVIDIEENSNFIEFEPGSNQWTYKSDESVKSKRFKDIIQLEIVSPVMDIEKGFIELEKVFNLLNSRSDEIETNETTGFHFSLSFKNKELNSKINKTILAGSVDYDSMQKQFREPTKYSMPISSLYKGLGKTRDIDTINKAYNRRKIQDVKPYQINMGKLAHYGYVEFRMIGGDDYTTKIDLIKSSVKQACKAMELSLQGNDKTLQKHALKKLHSEKQESNPRAVDTINAAIKSIGQYSLKTQEREIKNSDRKDTYVFKLCHEILDKKLVNRFFNILLNDNEQLEEMIKKPMLLIDETKFLMDLDDIKQILGSDGYNYSIVDSIFKYMVKILDIMGQKLDPKYLKLIEYIKRDVINSLKRKPIQRNFDIDKITK